jgi:hypothetical protein
MIEQFNLYIGIIAYVVFAIVGFELLIIPDNVLKRNKLYLRFIGVVILGMLIIIIMQNRTISNLINMLNMFKH